MIRRDKRWEMPTALWAAREMSDRLQPDCSASVTLHGVLGKTVDFVKQKQLYSTEHWCRFVEQFRKDSDGKSRGWRGEYWGKMMRGACFVYETAPDDRLADILRETAEDMIASADETGRISSYGVDTEYDGWDMWCRKYVMLGMEYYWEICKDEALRDRIVQSLRGQADAILAHIGPVEEGKKPVTLASRNWKGMNSVSILEPMVRLYHLTQDKRYLDFATYLVSTGGTGAGNLFELAEKGELYPYQYPVTKAYEMISCFEGLLEYARLTENERYKQATINFAQKIIESDVTVIGSCGCTHELFDHSRVRQTATDYEGVMQETCVTVTWMKFCTQLLYLTGDSVYADLIEQSLYNAYLGALNTEDRIPGGLPLEKHPNLKQEALPFDSYSPLVAGTRGRKIGGFQIMSDETYYGCCACIASAGVGLVSRVMVDRDKKGIYLNLYEDGSVKTFAPDGSDIEILIHTAYPAEGRVSLAVKGSYKKPYALYIRVPEWSRNTAVRLDGKEDRMLLPGQYQKLFDCLDGIHDAEVLFDMRVFAIQPYGVGFGKDILRVNVDWQNDEVIPSEYTEDPHARYHVAFRRGPLMLGVDARLGNSPDALVAVAADAEGVVAASEVETNKISYPCMISLDINQKDGSTFRVTDYASVGKTWSEASRCAVWLPVPENMDA